MMMPPHRFVRFGAALAIILITLGYLAYTGVEESKSYYVTIAELRGMGEDAHKKRLRVAGDVVPGTIKRQGTTVEFVLKEQEQTLAVIYKGTEAPPDTFKDDSQALVEGEFGRDGVFRAKHLQAKCASKYEKQEDGTTAPYEKKGEAPAKPSAPVKKTATSTT